MEGGWGGDVGGEREGVGEREGGGDREGGEGRGRGGEGREGGRDDCYTYYNRYVQ